MNTKHSSARGIGDHVRRALDVALAGPALVVLSPVLLVIAFAVRATSRGPVLFRQTRVGLDRAPFTIIKFRTMYDGADDGAHREYVTRLLTDERPPDGGEVGLFKLSADPRVTRVGRFLRRSSLDELPQLVNVLKGEMTLVGPRPMLPWEAELLSDQHASRFLVKPGLTGLWQVEGRSTVSMTEALDLDVRYVQTRSLALDVAILVRTLPVVLLGACTGRGVR